MSISGFSTPVPPVCVHGLGLENHDIKDLSLTASSEIYYSKAVHGRLYHHGSWAASEKNVHQWFQVEFRNWTKVTGVAIQGSGRWAYRAAWVTKFKLAYSDDGVFFSDYKEDGDNNKVLLLFSLRTSLSGSAFVGPWFKQSAFYTLGIRVVLLCAQ